MTFLEAPRSIEEMQEYCRRVPGPKLANMLEHGDTPILSPQDLKKIGYTMAAYPLTLLSASIKAMTASLERIHLGTSTDDLIVPFGETKDTVGFTHYAREEQRYKTS
jgi:2-methylisocitrate lyase-like PEP mutase family enzyme